MSERVFDRFLDESHSAAQERRLPHTITLLKVDVEQLMEAFNHLLPDDQQVTLEKAMEGGSIFGVPFKVQP